MDEVYSPPHTRRSGLRAAIIRVRDMTDGRALGYALDKVDGLVDELEAAERRVIELEDETAALRVQGAELEDDIGVTG